MKVNSVYNVNNYQQYRKQYIKLSTAINRNKQKGLDISQLLTQREQLKNVYSIQPNPVYNNERIQSPVNSVNKSQTVYKSNNIKEELKELKTLILEQKKQLENISQSLANFQMEIRKILDNSFNQQQSNSINRSKKEPNSELKSNLSPQPTTNKITFLFNQNILAEIQSFLTENPQLFSSFSHFIRNALLTYQNGLLKIDQQPQFNVSKSKASKKSVRMEPDLQNIYRNLPEGQKSQIFNQILASFLMFSKSKN